MLVFNSWLTEGIAELSYMIGDDSSRTAAVIDPRPDVEIYLEAARKRGLSITHIFETHIHADFMSGSIELASRTGSAEILVSGEGGASYGFGATKIRDGERFTIGDTLITARFTPGHTPEHMSYELARSDLPHDPYAILTGDSLFVDSVGRPDLLGDDKTEELVESLYHTMTEYFLKQPDHVIIHPCHGSGSACGPSLGDRIHSTIGFEREHNRFLNMKSLEEFKQAMLDDAPPTPTHYPRLKKVNAEGPEVQGSGPVVPALKPNRFRENMQEKNVAVVDSRHMLSFGGGHIPGSINISATKDEMSVFAGWVLDPDCPILLVLEDDEQLNHVTSLLVRTGFTRFAGYLAGGMSAWETEGYPLASLPQMHVQKVHQADTELQLVDVRQPDEWDQGRIPGAVHHFLGDLVDEIPSSLDQNSPLVTYCASGYRASVAASLLLKSGFQDVRILAGSWKAWTSAELPTES